MPNQSVTYIYIYNWKRFGEVEEGEVEGGGGGKVGRAIKVLG